MFSGSLRQSFSLRPNPSANSQDDSLLDSVPKLAKVDAKKKRGDQLVPQFLPKTINAQIELSRGEPRSTQSTPLNNESSPQRANPPSNTSALPMTAYPSVRHSQGNQYWLALQLQCAILGRDAMRVGPLLRQGADPSLCVKEITTALHTRSNSKAPEVDFDVLLDMPDPMDERHPAQRTIHGHGDAPSDLLNGTETALYVAISNGASEAILDLLFNAPTMTLSAAGPNGFAPIHAAVVHNNLNVLNRIAVAHKIHINLPDCRGNTPLHYSAVTGNFAAAARLLALGANPWPLNHKGSTPLDIAQRRKPASGATRLFEVIDKYQQCASRGMSLISNAAYYGDGNLVELLRSQIIFPHEFLHIHHLDVSITCEILLKYDDPEPLQTVLRLHSASALITYLDAILRNLPGSTSTAQLHRLYTELMSHATTTMPDQEDRIRFQTWLETCMPQPFLSKV